MNRPKVIYLAYQLNRKNGWGRCSINWINGTKSIVKDADILTIKGLSNEKAPWSIRPILRSFTNGRFKGVLLLIDYLFCSIILKKKYDIVHCMIEPLAPLAHKLAIKFNAKLIVHFIGTYCVQPVNTRWKELYHRI